MYKPILLYIILDTMDISNQGPTDLTIRELSPMEVQLCSQGETKEESLSEKISVPRLLLRLYR